MKELAIARWLACKSIKFFVRILDIGSVEGKAGSGKTLLVLDIAKDYIQESKKVGMIIGTKPSIGHFDLTDGMGIDLRWFYNLNTDDLINFINDNDVIILDEAQRIPVNIVETTFNSNDISIFCIDDKQIVHPEEIRMNVLGFLKTKTQNDNIYKLKKSMRFNDELEAFQKKFFNIHSHASYSSFNNVSLRFFKSQRSASEYIDFMCKSYNYVCIEPDSYTTKRTSELTFKHKYDYSNNVKEIIGQEFNNVLLVFTKETNYDKTGKIKFDSNFKYPYILDRMIYQAMTRASNSLIIVIIDNDSLYENVQQILTRSRDVEKKQKEKILELKNEIHKLKSQMKNCK